MYNFLDRNYGIGIFVGKLDKALTTLKNVG